MEAELKALDSDFEHFALEHGAKLVRKAKDWPGRSLEWNASVKSLLQIHVVDATSLAMDVWICVYQDRGGKRYWKNEMMQTEMLPAELARELPEILEAGKSKIDLWAAHPEELEFATDLQI